MVPRLLLLRNRLPAYGKMPGDVQYDHVIRPALESYSLWTYCRVQPRGLCPSQTLAKPLRGSPAGNFRCLYQSCCRSTTDIEDVTKIELAWLTVVASAVQKPASAQLKIVTVHVWLEVSKKAEKTTMQRCDSSAWKPGWPHAFTWPQPVKNEHKAILFMSLVTRSSSKFEHIGWGHDRHNNRIDDMTRIIWIMNCRPILFLLPSRRC